MAKRTRITLTKTESETATGKRLIDMILSTCHDGRLDIHEVHELHIFLRRDTSTIAAVQYLRAITRELVADGAVDDTEAYRLKLAFERVVPKEVRSVVSTHLQNIGLPRMDDDEPAWTRDEATERQIEYILSLGGVLSPQMNKGDASKLIEELLERRPPTPRQMMLLRFFDRLDFAQATKDDVSQWVDEFYAADARRERSWDRFKRATNHDPFGRDPTVVPVGAFRDYMEPQDGGGQFTKSSKPKGCLPTVIFGGLVLLACAIPLLQ